MTLKRTADDYLTHVPPEETYDSLDTDKLCDICCEIDFLAFFTKPTKAFRLGLLYHVFHCLDCPFCKYVASISKHLSSEAKSYTWGIVQRYLPAQEYLRLQNIAKAYQIDIRVYRSGHNTQTLSTLESCESHVTAAAADFSMVRRPLRDCFDPKLLSYWLEASEHSSGRRFKERATSNSQALQNLLDLRKFRVLDVNSGNVVALRQFERYLALSYVWGASSSVQHCLRPSRCPDSNVVWAVDIEQVPRTIRDAASLVRKIGERYLWVDSLCIDQSDTDDKGTLVAEMNSIYGTAEITIVAADGDDADAGLKRLEKHPSYPERPLCLSHAGRSFSVLPIRSNYDQAIEQTKWNTRGWTYQEYTLSRQCVVFTANEVFFSGLGVYEREAYALLPSQGTSDSCKKAKRRTGRLWTAREAVARGTNESFNQVERYSKAVQEYSRRTLSFPGDRLDAFWGILLSFADASKPKWEIQALSGFIVPNDNPRGRSFDDSLHWQPAPRVTERSIRIQYNTMRTWKLPSWSWVGWSGEVRFSEWFQPQLSVEVIDATNIKVLGSFDWPPHKPQLCEINPELGVVLHFWTPILWCKIESQPFVDEESTANDAYSPHPIILQSADGSHRYMGTVLVDKKFVLEADESTLHEFVVTTANEESFPVYKKPHLRIRRMMLVQRCADTQFVERVALSNDSGIAIDLEELSFEHVKII